MKEGMTRIVIRTVVVVFNVSGIDYYTYQNIDQGLSDSTNIDTARKAVEKAITCAGMIEGHAFNTGDRVFINMKECNTAAVKSASIVTLTGEI